MVVVGKETTITTKLSHWAKFLLTRAKVYAPKLDGGTPTQGEYMEECVALRSIRILRNVKEYELIKKNYEGLYGPVDEITERVEITEAENGEEIEPADDPYFEETQEG